MAKNPLDMHRVPLKQAIEIVYHLEAETAGGKPGKQALFKVIQSGNRPIFANPAQGLAMAGVQLPPAEPSGQARK